LSSLNLKIPEIFEPIWAKDKRYNFLKGGRGSGKSWAVADRLIVDLVTNPNKSLVCLREIQRSIKHSSKKLLEDRIRFLNLQDHFTIKDQEIDMVHGDGVIIFNGLQNHTADSIKSLEGFDLCWVEEAMTISAYSLELLIPTIRKRKSKLFFTWNPKRKDDPVETLMHDAAPGHKIIIHANYTDNPFCPDSIHEEASAMKTRSAQKYRHIYLGDYGVAEGLIFENVTRKAIHENEYKRLECLQGIDFGFTNDPTAFCIIYLDTAQKKLFVVDGFYKKGLLNSMIADEIRKLNAHRHLTRADSAEPKTIASLKGKGVRVVPADKGKDSIIAGIDFLQEYDIIVNSHLNDFWDEFQNYTWEMDKMTGEPLNRPIDDYNHFIDALRYSVSHLYKRRGKYGAVQKPTGV